MNEIEKTIEALLFIYGGEMSYKKLAQAAKVSEDEVKEAIGKVQIKLKKESGLNLIIKDGSVKMVTKPEEAGAIERLIKDEFEAELTPAALETLTIILYLGPVSRAEIDYIRGVNSSFILRALILRGLIERHKGIKKSYLYLYEATMELLQYLGVAAAAELPDYEKYKNDPKFQILTE